MTTLRARAYSAKTAFSLTGEGVHPLLSRIFAARGVARAGDVAGRLGELLHYSTLKGAREAAVFLADCIKAKRHIVVVADYDCDGATACATAVRGLRAMGGLVDYVVPDRFIHGYGLTPGVVDLALEAFPKLDVLLTVDNGTASHAGVEYAVAKGLEVLVTDHHMPSKSRELPPAAVLVNPQQAGCAFESKALAGVGVIWYVLWALQDELRSQGRGVENFKVSSLLPLVAIGSVADVVPLDKNNRILVDTGLRLIRASRAFSGINALARAGKFNKTLISELTTTDIAFGIGPRINAAGRLQTMNLGIDCLLEDDPAKAEKMAQELDGVNQTRKEVEHGIVLQAFEEAQALVAEGTMTIVVCKEGWHHGVIGIVAGRIKERRWRPTFVLAPEEDGSIKGSGRSIPGFNMKDALDHVDKEHPGLLVKFGGHAMAAGVTIRPGGLEQFKRAFEDQALKLLTPDVLRQVLEHDGSLSGAELTTQTARVLETAPWGQAFPAPSFCDEFDVVSATLAGQRKDQLKLLVQKNGIELAAVKFRHDGAVPQGKVRLVYKLARNTDRYGEESVKLMIEHIEAFYAIQEKPNLNLDS